VRNELRFFEPRLASKEKNEEVVRALVRDVAATYASASMAGKKQWHTQARCRLAREGAREAAVARAAGRRELSSDDSVTPEWLRVR
jgi:hypothetical protein